MLAAQTKAVGAADAGQPAGLSRVAAPAMTLDSPSRKAGPTDIARVPVAGDLGRHR